MNDAPLSPREKQILRRIAAGKTDAEIGKSLGGDIEQIADQRARLLNKLGISTMTEIGKAAERLAHLSSYRGVT
jgi:DNA-binding CsgD family transcriptional regulator